MKKYYFVFVVLLCCFTAANIYAQTASSSMFSSTKSGGGEGGMRFGLKAGVNFAGFNGKGAEDVDGRIGFNAGVFGEYVLPSNVYFLSGVDFTTKGGKREEKEDGVSYTTTHSPLYLQLPIHIGYLIDISDGMSLGLHAGPYLAYGIGGKVKMEGKEEGITASVSRDFFGSEEDGGAKSFDAGLGFGATLNIGKVRFGLGYDLGLSNISRDNDYPVKNRNFSINVGYAF